MARINLNIRSKLLLAFALMLVPFLVIMALAYHDYRLYHGYYRAMEAIHQKVHFIYRLQLAIERSLMPGNDYIITGERLYARAFGDASVDVEGRLAEVEAWLRSSVEPFPGEDEVPRLEAEAKILEQTKKDWQDIKEITLRIFEVREPVGDAGAAAIMEEMDYKLTYPVTERLRAWREMSEKEVLGFSQKAQALQRRTMRLFVLTSLAFVAFGVLSALLLARSFSAPIMRLSEEVDRIASGELGHRVEIRTGDEVEHLANRFNYMAGEVARSHGELEAMVRERTAELEKTVARLKDSRRAIMNVLSDVESAKKEWMDTFDAITDPLFIHDSAFRIVRVNKAYAEAAGASPQELIGKRYYEAFPKMEGPFNSCKRALELQEEEEIFLPSIDRTFKAKFYQVRDAQGRYLYSVHILEDITELKRATDRIKNEMEISTNLLMVADAIAYTTDMELMIERVTSCTARVTGADACLVFLFDSETKVFSPAYAFGLVPEQNSLFRSTWLKAGLSFIEKAVKKARPDIVDAEDGDAMRGAFPWLEGFVAAAVMPLTGRAGPLGLQIALFRRKKAFGERDLRVMEGISNQVSTAFEEAMHYKETVDRTLGLSRRMETIKVMHEIDRAILSTLERSEILETATRLVSMLMPAARCSIVLVDMERSGFVYEAGFGVDFVKKGGFVPFEDTDATEILRTRKPQCVTNLSELKGLRFIEEGLLKEGFLSHMRVPIMIKGEVAGLLSVGTKRPSAYSTEDLATLEKLASQVAVAMENARILDDLKGLFIATLKTLSNAIDAKSPWTRGHSERVTKIALEIGKELGLKERELENLEVAGLLHDIGKLGTYEDVLNKPGKLTDEELNLVRQHPVKGAQILEPIKQLKDIIPAVKYHQEFFDGSGYPEGIKGEDIPLMARILGVADTVDAMGADRPYRKGKPMEEIVAELKRCSGTQFDPKIVEVFLRKKTSN